MIVRQSADPFVTETQVEEEMERVQTEKQRKVLVERIAKGLGQNFNEFYQRYFF